MQAALQAILLVLAGVAVGRGQAPSSPAPALPPSAQRAFQKGLRAAEKGDWAKALDLLEQARQQAPQAPEVLCQLARTESQIGGRELRAMAWFEAYLAVNPHSPDRAQVETEMTALETKVHANVARLIAAARSSLPQVSEHTGKESVGRRVVSQPRDALLREIGDTQVETGDYAGALQTASGLEDSTVGAWIMEKVVKAQVRRGDIAGALETAKQVPNVLTFSSSRPPQMASARAESYISIAVEQAKRGDAADAKQSETLALQAAANVKGDKGGPGTGSGSYAAIADALTKHSDFTAALRAAALIENSFVQPRVYYSIAMEQAKHGSTAAALETASHMEKTPAKPFNKPLGTNEPDVSALISLVYSAVAEAYAGQGNIAAAQHFEAMAGEAATTAPDLYGWIGAFGTLAREQAERGDFPAAFETAKKLQDTVRAAFQPESEMQHLRKLESSGLVTAKEVDESAGEFRALARLVDAAEIPASEGNFAAAVQAAENIPDKQIRNEDIMVSIGAGEEIYAEVARQQARHGDIATALQTVDRIARAGYKSGAYCGIAGEEAKRGDVAGAKGAEVLALKWAQEIPEGLHRNEAYTALAQEQAGRDDPAAALQTVEAIADPSAITVDEFIKTYASIADAQARQGDSAAAGHTLLSAAAGHTRFLSLPFIQDMAAPLEQGMHTVCFEIAERLARLNDFGGAFGVLESWAFTSPVFTDFQAFLRSESGSSKLASPASSLLRAASALSTALEETKTLNAKPTS
jgi:tetratricopeptide (TPR) repeat protein